jgi:hypothetical protein
MLIADPQEQKTVTTNKKGWPTTGPGKSKILPITFFLIIWDPKSLVLLIRDPGGPLKKYSTSQRSWASL